MCPIEQTLYEDPQCRPSKRCPRCGREVYAPSYFCLHCQEERP